VLDFSKCKDFYQTFANNYSITKLPVIDFSSTTRLNATFYYAGTLKTIEKVIVNRNLTDYYIAFVGMTNLKNIIFEGEIAASISFAGSAYLTNESIQSIIDCLVDYSGTDTSPVLTLHKDIKAKLTPDQIAQITNKNWTLA
jgi:hypothetical protein